MAGLPNPGMSFTAFTTGTVADMNKMVANDQALADGSGINDGAILPASLSADATGYLPLGRTTLTGNGDVLSVSGFTPKRYLRAVAHIIPSGIINNQVTFNGDGASNYSETYQFNGGASTQSPTTSSINAEASNGVYYEFIVIEIVNRSSYEKFGTLMATVAQAGAGASIQDFISKFKWANTSQQINTITMTNSGAGDFASGSELVVFGKD